MSVYMEKFAQTPDRSPAFGHVSHSLLVQDVTCWRIERAARLTVIVDAARYFQAVRQAILEARHSVLLIGWDFDTRVTLDHEASDDAPAKLGQFLTWIAKRRPSLQIQS